MLLCAGYGSRLGALTKATPKPMLEVAGRPILDYTLSHLAAHGVSEVGINLHFRPQVIQEFVGDGGPWGVSVTYSKEDQLLGTAGAVAKMRWFLEDCDAFLVLYGDILTDQSLSDLVRFHIERQALMSMLVHESRSSNSIVRLDGHGAVTGFWERPDARTRNAVQSNWASSSIFVGAPAVLDQIPSRVPCDIPKDLLPPVLRQGRLYGYPLTGFRCAIDSPARLTRAGRALAGGSCGFGVQEGGFH